MDNFYVKKVFEHYNSFPTLRIVSYITCAGGAYGR